MKMSVRLKYWRTVRAMSIDDLAARAKMSTQTIVNIEKYGKIPRPKTLHKLTEALDVTLDDLMIVEEENGG